MLEGMANHQRRALFELTRNLLLYAPACRKENFINAIGYLIRRLDENTGPENFLRHAFKIEVDSPEWQQLEQGFLAAFDAIAHDRAMRRGARRTATSAARRHRRRVARGWQQLRERTGHRLRAAAERRMGEADRRAAGSRAAATQARADPAGHRRRGDARGPRRCATASIPRGPASSSAAIARRPTPTSSAPWSAPPPIRTAGATMPVDAALRHAGPGRAGTAHRARRSDGRGAGRRRQDARWNPIRKFPRRSISWSSTATRRAGGSEMPTLQARAEGRGRRGAAVEFSDRDSVRRRRGGAGGGQHRHPQARVRHRARRLGAVPVLLARGRVEDGAAVRAVLRRQRRPQARQPSEGRRGDPHRRHRDGADDAATTTRACNLFAETGGKNATIVTALSDRDQAIKHVLHSAFSHSGQKCSATSLLMLEARSTTTRHSGARCATRCRA